MNKSDFADALLQSPGMTLRQWYAGQALAGVMANEALMKQLVNTAMSSGVPHLALVAELCREQADAMIAALKETGDA